MTALSRWLALFLPAGLIPFALAVLYAGMIVAIAVVVGPPIDMAYLDLGVHP